MVCFAFNARYWARDVAASRFANADSEKSNLIDVVPGNAVAAATRSADLCRIEDGV